MCLSGCCRAHLGKYCPLLNFRRSMNKRASCVVATCHHAAFLQPLTANRYSSIKLPAAGDLKPVHGHAQIQMSVRYSSYLLTTLSPVRYVLHTGTTIFGKVRISRHVHLYDSTAMFLHHTCLADAFVVFISTLRRRVPRNSAPVIAASRVLAISACHACL